MESHQESLSTYSVPLFNAIEAVMSGFTKKTICYVAQQFNGHLVQFPYYVTLQAKI